MLDCNQCDIPAPLHQHREAVAQWFGEQQFGLFGSAARYEMRPDSEVAVRVGFSGPATCDA